MKKSQSGNALIIAIFATAVKFTAVKKVAYEVFNFLFSDCPVLFTFFIQCFVADNQ